MNYRIIVVAKNNLQHITGGQFVNQRIYQLLCGKGCEISYSSDMHPAKSNLRYLLINLIYINEYRKFSYIITDSSGFPKTFWFVALYNLLYGKRQIITTLHHFVSEGISGVKGWLYRKLEHRFVRMCGKVIVFSPYVLDQCRKFVDESHIWYIGLPFDKSIIPTSIEQKRFGKFLYVGTVEPRKGLSYLVEALHRVPLDQLRKMEVNIVGKVQDSSYYDNLLEKIATYGLTENVRFRGRVTDEELKSYYKDSMAFVFPTLLEGYGMVVTEAMGYGMPVVAFNNSAMPYIINHGQNGLLAKNKDVDDLAQCIVTVLSDADSYKRMCEGAIASFSKVNGQELFDALVDKCFKSLKYEE